MDKPTVLLLTTRKHSTRLTDILAELGYDAIIVTAPDYPSEDLTGCVDVLLSFCYPLRIKEPFLTGLKLGAINFHPAPLPQYRGFAIYNFCILNCERTWGVTAHYVDKTFDTGDVIDKIEFPILANTVTVQSLRDITHVHLIQLFERVLWRVSFGARPPAERQGAGNYYSKQMMEEQRRVKDGDSAEMISRKIRAFWCPPHPGAYVVKDGKEFTLVTESILQDLEESNG